MLIQCFHSSLSLESYIHVLVLRGPFRKTVLSHRQDPDSQARGSTVAKNTQQVLGHLQEDGASHRMTPVGADSARHSLPLTKVMGHSGFYIAENKF